MSFDRYCGMASAAAILLILSLNAWLGLWGPVWHAVWEMKAADALGVVIAVIGWIVTIALGGIGFYFAFRQIRLAQSQLQLQQDEIRAAANATRRANYLRLSNEVSNFGRDIDRLMTAKGYLGTFTGTFPTDGRLHGWSVRLVQARSAAEDFISQAAVSAPFGYGERVSTVMSRIQRLGDMLATASRDMQPSEGIAAFYDPRIKAAIEGIRTIEGQITAEIPIRQQQMLEMADERDTYAPIQIIDAHN